MDELVATNPFVVAVFCLCIACGTIVAVVMARHLFLSIRDRFSEPEKVAPHQPVIGYKVSNVCLTQVDEERGTLHSIFQGCMGGFYESNEEGPRHNFHFYNRYSSALAHGQKHNALLEVVGYGRLAEYELGWITSGQRVLQVMPTTCKWCTATPQWLTLSGSFACDSCSHGGDIPLARLYGRTWVDQKGTSFVIASCQRKVKKDLLSTTTVHLYTPTKQFQAA